MRPRTQTFAWLTLGVITQVSLCTTCSGATWTAGPSVRADPRRVALALGDQPPHITLALSDLPQLVVPHHPRMCCAFGMDMHVDLGALEVPFFEVGNVIGEDELHEHIYDLPTGALDSEVNGLIYTCRGGWIDTSHVRENADNVLYLALTIAPHLATGMTLEIPGFGAPTRLIIDPVPARVLARETPLSVATAFAGWIAYRVGIWHEVMTWYGYEMVAGFSEQPSAFSPEDLYSNLLGIRLAMAALDERAFGGSDDYNEAIAAYIDAALDRLEAQPRILGRGIMTGLDGAWWDSTRRLPDNLLVQHRRFPSRGETLAPWRAEDVETAPAMAVLRATLAEGCGETRTSTLAIPGDVGRISARNFAHLSWVPEGWADSTFPFREGAGRRVDEADLDGLVEQAHAAMELVFGAGFDRP